MVRTLSILIAAAGAVLFGASLAVAQPGVSPEVALRYLDADRDGKVSLNDWLTFQVTKMAAADVDQNGELTYKEFKTTLQGRALNNAEQSFNAFNREGRQRSMNQREFLGYHAYVFNTFLDTTKDGALSLEEYEKMMGGLNK
jgi:Ca2+-binding EF-hand superfamily protein